MAIAVAGTAFAIGCMEVRVAVYAVGDEGGDPGGDPYPTLVSWQGLAGSDFGPYGTRITSSNIAGGGVSNSAGISGGASIVLEGGRSPVVAWYDDTPGQYEIYLRRWDGSAWQELGGSATGGGLSNSAGDSDGPTIALDANRRPIVSWQDSTPGNVEVYVRAWNGSAWTELAGSGTGAGISNNTGYSGSPYLALEGANPVVAWDDDTAVDWEIYARRWNGTAWQALGGSATAGGLTNNTGDSVKPCIAADATGMISAAWSDDTSGAFATYVRRWNGTAWQELAGSATGGGLGAAVDTNYGPVIALDSAGAPYVAWTSDVAGNHEIMLRYWTGTLWSELGGSGSNGGLSSNSGLSEFPALALDAAGRPYVAWQDDTSGNFEIYLKRWTGSAWAEMEGSATAGGVSNSDAASTTVALAVGAVVCMAWQEMGLTSDEIVMRCHEP